MLKSSVGMLVICVAGIAGNACGLAQDDGDWSQWGGSNRDFHTQLKLSEIETQRPPELVWSSDVAGGNAGITIEGNRVVAFGRQGNREIVQCFGLSQGALLWSFDYEVRLPDFIDPEFGAGPHSTPLLTNGLGFAIGIAGRVTCFSLAAGEILWTRDLWKDFPATQLERGFASSPLLSENSLVIAAGGKGCAFVALDIQDGSTGWATQDFVAGYTSPILVSRNGTQQVIALMDRDLVGVDAKDGSLLWELPFVSQNTVHVASPIEIGRDRLFIGSSDRSMLIRQRGGVTALEVEAIWESRAMRPQLGNLLSIGNCVVGPSSGSPGRLTTTFLLGDRPQPSKLRIGGRGFYYACQDGFISITETGDLAFAKASAGDFQVINKIDGWLGGRQWSTAAFGPGWIVIRNGNALERYRFRAQ